MNLDAFTLPITDPVLIFGLTMMLLLLVPFLFKRLRVPDVLGLILAGAVVGPFGLGLLERVERMCFEAVSWESAIISMHNELAREFLQHSICFDVLTRLYKSK
jgi:Kef-type K+ transport system membrane component KefB